MLIGMVFALVACGGGDDTPPAAQEEAAAAVIPRTQYVPIPNAWHSIMGNNGDCPTDITLQFLTDPDGAVDDSSPEAWQPVFVLPDDDLGLSGGDK